MIWYSLYQYFFSLYLSVSCLLQISFFRFISYGNVLGNIPVLLSSKFFEKSLTKIYKPFYKSYHCFIQYINSIIPNFQPYFMGSLICCGHIFVFVHNISDTKGEFIRKTKSIPIIPTFFLMNLYDDTIWILKIKIFNDSMVCLHQVLKNILLQLPNL